MKKNIFNTIKIIVLGLALSAGIAFATNSASFLGSWNIRPAVPLANNTFIPINIGNIDQIRHAGLLAQNIVSFGQSRLFGDTSILATPANGGMHGVPTNGYLMVSGKLGIEMTTDVGGNGQQQQHSSMSRNTSPTERVDVNGVAVPEVTDPTSIDAIGTQTPNVRIRGLSHPWHAESAKICTDSLGKLIFCETLSQASGSATGSGANGSVNTTTIGGVETIVSSGSWTVPSNVAPNTPASFEVWGGGGAGGGSGGTSSTSGFKGAGGGGGGGGGHYLVYHFINPGEVYNVTIGNGGTLPNPSGGAAGYTGHYGGAGHNGNPGGTTSVTKTGVTIAQGAGGAGGAGGGPDRLGTGVLGTPGAGGAGGGASGFTGGNTSAGSTGLTASISSCGGTGGAGGGASIGGGATGGGYATGVCDTSSTGIAGNQGVAHGDGGGGGAGSDAGVDVIGGSGGVGAPGAVVISW